MIKIPVQKRTQLKCGYKNYFIQLQKDFGPTHIINSNLAAGTEYNFSSAFISFASTRKTLFNWTAEASKGIYYNGKIQYIQGTMKYRYQPYLNVSLNFNYTDLNLPQPFKDAKLWFIGPKLDVTFTDKIFWSTFVQYNEKIDNMNINMRLQWRYQLISDLFIVYTDNYIPDTWNSINRALVLKLTYWSN